MYKYISLIIVGIFLNSGCAGTAEYGKVVNGEYIPLEYIKAKGNIKGEFPSGHKIENRPTVELPKLPPISYKKEE